MTVEKKVAACTCTQSVLDLFMNKGAVAIMENSAHRYLIVSPYSMLMYSSKAEDVTAIRSYRDQGLSLEQAIKQVIDDRGRSEMGGLN